LHRLVLLGHRRFSLVFRRGAQRFLFLDLLQALATAASVATPSPAESGVRARGRRVLRRLRGARLFLALNIQERLTGDRRW
jgi:hypothetical protein